MATVFKDEQHLYRCIGEFIKKISMHEEIGPKYKYCGLIIKYQFDNPASEITIDAKNICQENGYFKVYCGKSDLEPDLTLVMEADIAHRCWSGSLDMITALTRRQIVARGPVHIFMRMLPSLKKPSRSIYKQHLKEIEFQGD
ncbi:MAG: hypothetical protein GX973_00935 [Firmicutes bacterium]|nr:hypothetical protein [Bacillota bacterium]